MKSDLVLVPREINREQHRRVLEVWNAHMRSFSTLEVTWPALVAAFETIAQCEPEKSHVA